MKTARSQHRRRSSRLRKARFSWTSHDVQENLNTRFLRSNYHLWQERLAIYVLRVLFDGIAMTKIGIVRSGTLGNRMKNHLKKKHYTNIRVLKVLTLSANTYDNSKCSAIVCNTESKIFAQLKKQNKLRPTPVPGTAMCEVEVVLRQYEHAALEAIKTHTSVTATKETASRC